MFDKTKLLILDLDETLIYASITPLETRPYFKLDKYHIYKRPFLNEFLLEMSNHFQIAIWSSAGDEYVNAITKLIKPDDITFLFVWGRSKCSLKRDPVFDEYIFEKRIDKVKKFGFSLVQVLIIDDTPLKARTNYGNAVYVKEFKGSEHDAELKLLQQYLLSIKDIENVRTIEKRNWRNNFKP